MKILSLLKNNVWPFLRTKDKANIASDSVRKTALLNAFCLSGLLASGIFGIEAHLSHNFSYGFLLNFIFILFLAIYVYVIISKKYKVASYIFLSITFVFFIYLIIGVARQDKTAPLWLYVFPALALFLTNHIIGVILSLLLILTSFILINITPSLAHEYSHFYQSRYFSTLLGDLFLCWTFEYIRGKTYKMMEQAKHEIQTQAEQLLRTNTELEEKNILITDSITYAQAIQQVVLPSENIIKQFIPDFFIFFKPKDIVSGDFYWFYHKDDKLFFAVADCTGHGVPGALMSMIGMTLLNEIVKGKGIMNPSDILFELNKEIIFTLKQNKENIEKNYQGDGMDISLCVIDNSTRKLHIACASHSAFILQNGTLIRISGDSFAIGGLLSTRMKVHFHETIFDIESGLSIYMFTDGYTDQFNGKSGDKFGYSRLKNLISESSDLSIEEQLKIFSTTFEEWKLNEKQIDDVLLVGLRIN